MHTTSIRAVGASAALAVLLAACPADDPTTEPTATPSPSASEAMSEPMGTGDPFADLKASADHVLGSAEVLAAGIAEAISAEGDPSSQAAGVRAALTGLLQEHVYLAGIAVDIGLTIGLDSAEFGLAAAALDTNSVELSELVASVAGQENGDTFLELWRAHVGFFVDYAKGVATGDEALKADALTKLDGYRGGAGNFFEIITDGAITQEAVADNLTGHIDTLTAAIDAAAAGETAVFELLRAASDHVEGSALALSGAIVTAAGMEGEVDSAGANLRATLTALLQEHVYLAGIAVKTAYAAGLDSAAFTAAAASLDENSQALADAVKSVAGEENGDAFLELWRAHVGFFVDYATGVATGDEALKADAQLKLDGYRTGAGDFFSTVTGGVIDASAVALNLKGHISTLSGAIDSLAAALLG